MNKISLKRSVLALFVSLAVIAGGLPVTTFSAAAEGSDSGSTTDYTQFVDPFVATAVDNGQQWPGAVVPYGIVKMNADTYPHTTDTHSGYDYNASMISGFSHTRIEGVGGQGAGGDVLVTPTYVSYTGKPSMESRAQSFLHDTETASPGYYSVELTPKTGADAGTEDRSFGNILAENTATTRTGFQKYTFPQEGKVSVVVDLNYTYHGTDVRNAVMNVTQTEDGRVAISGRFSGRNVSGHGLYTMYFYMETDTAVTDIHTWNGDDYSDCLNQTGNDLGAVLTFDVDAGQAVQLKVGISPISAEQAQVDMAAEDAGWNFDAVRQAAKNAWNDILGRVDIESSETSDPDGTLKNMFYTELYRMFTTPVNATSTSGTYRGTDGKIYEADGYTHYDSWTLWDDFKKYPMIGLICPEIYKDIIRSVADMLVTGISTWGNDTQPVLTVRNEHAVALLADGIAKGYTDIPNLEEAYEAAKAIADSAVTDSVESLGYFTGRVDKTVEYAYDDWALSIIADSLGKTEESDDYLERSFNYKNLYKSNAATNTDGTAVGLLWPKDSSGNWMSADPEAYGNNGLYQGTLWQYTFWDANDVGGLIDLMGGQSSFLSALNTLFGAKGEDADGSNMLHSNTNEIDLQTPYYFNYAGKPSETQYWVRQIYTGKTWNRYSGTGEYNPPIYTEVYSDSPDGLLTTMDDDAGTMATMYVSAAMGLFSIAPGNTTFQIGTPFFEKMTLNLGGGKTFTINANNVSADSYYIQSATLNGSSLDRTWLDYSEIARGGEVTFEMGSTASAWGEDSILAASSSDSADTSTYSSDAISFSTSTFEESTANDGSIANTIEITVNGATIAATDADLVAAGKVTVSNLPAGLTASAVKSGSNTITLSLVGNAVLHAKNDSTDDVTLTLSDGLFSASVTSDNKTKALRIEFDDPTITYSATKIESTEGSVDAYITADLSGGAAFSETAASAITASNLPDGVSLSVERVSDSRVKLHFSGQMTDIQSEYMSTDVTLSVGDAAFADGLPASRVEGSALSGLNALTLVNTMTPQSLNVTPPAKVDYAPGERLEMGGGSVTIYYGAGFTKTLPLSSEFLTVGAVPQTPGDNQSVTVSYGTVSGSFSVNVGTLKADENGAILHYDFSEASDGTVSDLTGNGYDGTLVNGATVENGSVSLNGAYSQYVDIPTNAAAALADTATVSMWVKVSSSDSQTLMTLGQSSSTGFQWMTGNIRSTIAKNGSSQSLSTEKTAAAGQWAYLTYVQSNGKVILYLNGIKLKVAVPNISLSDVVADGSIFRLGGSGLWSDASLTGKISDFAIYNTALSDDQIAAEMARSDNQLSECKQEAESLLAAGGYTAASTAALRDAIDYAAAVLNLPSPTEEQVSGAEDGLSTAMAGMRNTYTNVNAYAKLEAESYSAWSAGNLKTETSTDNDGNTLVNIGATYSDAWIEYKSLNFGNTGAAKISVRYTNNSGRCASDARIDVYLDSVEGSPVDSISIPATGDAWKYYSVATAALSAGITGTHDVYFVLAGTTTSSQPYICNLDWIQFTEGVLNGYETLEAEAKDDWSGGSLKTETSTDSSGASLTNLGGTYDGAWIKYSAKEFGETGADKIAVRYVNNSGRCGTNARIDLYLDSMDGDPISSVSIPATGDAWKYYSTITANLSATITGTHDVYLVLHADSNNPYVCNLDWVRFDAAVSKADLQTLYDENSALLDAASTYIGADFTIFQTAMTNAKQVLDSSDATSDGITEALIALNSAVGGLRTLPDKTDLNSKISEVSGLDLSLYTAVTAQAVRDTLALANAVSANSAATKYDVSLSLQALTDAMSALEEAPDEDLQAAQAVMNLIAALGEITSPDQKPSVAAVRAAYMALTAGQRALVTNISVLEAAEAKIAELEENDYLSGDVDGDGRVTVSDVVELRGVILSADYTNKQLKAGDLNASGTLTVSDVVDLRDKIMKGN